MKSKLTMLLLALVIAFGLWFYVITVVSPDSEISINNVSVQSQGEKLLLEQSNLMVVTDMSDLEVDLVLNGNRTDLIKLSRSNITITVDVSKIDRAGKHEVTYVITLPGDIPSNAVSVQTRDPDRLTLVVENRVRNPEVPLRLVYDKAQLPGNYTLKESAMEYPEFITVSGPESIMKDVAYAEVKLDLEGRQESYIEENIPYVLYDKDGEEIESELLTHDGSVLLTAPINYTKTLPLKLQLKAGGGATEKDAQVRFFIPKAEDAQEDEEISGITVSGSKPILDGESSLTLASLDLASVRDGDKLTFNLEELPLLKEEGINNESGITEIYAIITFPQLKEQEFQDVIISTVGEGEGLQANLSQKRISIIVRGPAALVDALERSDFSAVVDMTGVTESKEYYPVRIIFGEGFEQLGALTSTEDILVEVIRLTEDDS